VRGTFGIFSRIFPPYHSPETTFEVQKSAKKMQSEFEKCLDTRDLDIL